MRRHVAILIASVIVTLLGGIAASRVRIDSNLVALMPENARSIVALDELIHETGGAGDLMVMFESQRPDAALLAARRLLPQVRQLEWVEDARFGFDADFFRRNGLLYLDLSELREAARRLERRIELEIARRNPLYIDLEEDEPPASDLLELGNTGKLPRSPYFTSDDGRRVVMVIRPGGISSDIAFVKRIHGELTRLVSRLDTTGLSAPVEVSIGGTFENRLTEYSTLIDDIRDSALWVALGMTSLLALFFRSVTSVAVIAVPLAMALSWTFAFVYFAFGTLNTVTVFLIVILAGLGIDFGIHALSRFQTERASGCDVHGALSRMFATSGRASLIANATSAAGFFALVPTDFRGFSQFGAIATAGLVTSSLAYVVVLPALLAWIGMRPLMKPRPAPGPGKPLPRAPLLLSGVVALSAAMVWAARDVTFEYDLRELRAPAPATREFNAKMRTVFPRARDPAAAVVDGPLEARALHAILEERRDGTEESLIAEVQSAAQLLPSDVDEKLELIANIRARMDRLSRMSGSEEPAWTNLRAMLQPAALHSVAQLPPEVTRPFLGRPDDPREVVYIYQRTSLMDLRNALTFSDELADLRVHGKDVRAVSEPLVFADMLRLVESEAPRALGLGCIAILIILALDLRSLSGVMYALLPLGLGLLWMAGAMAVFRVKFNILNVPVLAAVLGLGVDGGVHIYRRYRELGPDRMTLTLRTTGAAVGAGSITSMIGFGTLLTATHPGLRSVGALALLGLGACLAASLLALPALLSVLRPPRTPAVARPA